MPKIPYKPEQARENDEDYEIVSFEDFCDKSPNAKTDLLTLNDNINYRLCYDSEINTSYASKDGESSKEMDDLKETSLGGTKSSNWTRKGSSSFAPFGRYNPNSTKGSLFSGVIPKPKNDGESTREHRYQRFSTQAPIYQRITDTMRQFSSTIILISIVCALSVGVWYAVCGAVGDGGDRHYKTLWERAHQHPTPPTVEKIMPEYHYHDHNNLSTKNKLNATENSRKKSDFNKKSAMYLERTPATLSGLCAKLTVNERFDCYPQEGANEEGCIKRGCCWNATASLTEPTGIPYCYYPPEYDTYHFINMTENRHGITVYYGKMRPSSYPDDFEVARMEFKYISNDVLQIKISDAENKRFEPPYPETPMINGPINDLKYRVVLESSVTGFKVIRNEDNVTIIDTQNVGGMVLSDKFLELSTLLPSDKIYGIGERRGSLKVDMNWQTYTLFNFDTPPVDNMNLYGSHPFYLGVEESGNSHGVLLLNSNAMDVVVQPTPAITYRTIGGVLNFFVMLGPSSGDVISQYTGMIGRPFMPPYWSLGFHLCRFNYGSLNKTHEVWLQNRDAGIPFDVQWNDLDYMNNSNDFTYDKRNYKGLPKFVDQLHNLGMHYIILIDPGISGSEVRGEYPPYDRGLELDVFVKNSTLQPFVGKVWNKKSTVYPDFTHPSASSYWVEMMSAFQQLVSFDGAWIDMNEPSNFLSGSMYGKCEPENLPYRPRTIGQDGLKTKTLCMDAIHYAGLHYDWHNLYSLTESIVTHFALTEIRGRRPFIISRSTFVGSGHYAGHWSGDVFSKWDDMKMSIPEILSFSLFGIPMMGADICGFIGDTTVELCKRWMQLGAFYPFSRNHNDDKSRPQDPVSLGEEVVIASKAALRIRYLMLPYLYTLFWRAHVYGDTVARPLLFEFPNDKTSLDIETQYLLGPHIMICPILDPGVNFITPYLPGDEPWMVMMTGDEVKGKIDENSTVLLRAGSIIPLQTPPLIGPVTTTNSRSGPIQLLVMEDSVGIAAGELYWDDGDSLNSYEEKKYSHINFKKGPSWLNSTINWWGYGVPIVSNITFYNVKNNVKNVNLNNKVCKKPYCEYSYDGKKKQFKVFNINLSLDKPLSLTWAYKHALPKLPKNISVKINETVTCTGKNCTQFENR